MDNEPQQGLQLADLRKAPAERAAAAVLPASAIVWAAAEIMHWRGIPADDAALAGALAAALAWGASGHWRNIPRRVAAWIAVTGGWLTLATAESPLHWWPYAPLTWGWAITSFVAWRKARNHPSVLAAQEWRRQRAEWLWRSREWGLPGSHLIGFEETRLGESYELDVRGTGKRASQIEHSSVAEVIAENELLPVSRVRVTRHRLAGRVRVSLRRTDPWAKPILHPALDDDPEIQLAFHGSIRTPAQVGQDPETGRVLEVPLWDEIGGKNVVIVALKGSGKTVLLDDLSERITAADDALQVRVNLSVKGHAESERWGPACHLTAFGPRQAGRAVRVLRMVNGIIEWRAHRYTTGQWTPSSRDPLVTVIIDEADSAMAVAAVRKEIDTIATKGREYGITLVRAGQRGTTDYGSAKARAQDDVFVIGRVNRQGEAYHAAGSIGFSLPDMANYGEGHSGVWAVAELGGSHYTGRAWLFRPADAARIAKERAFSQPDLDPACREFLGEQYEELLSTDVFAEWARDREAAPVMAASSGGSGNIQSELETSESPLTDGPAERDPLRHLDFNMTLDPDDQAKLAALDARNNATRRLLAEDATMPKPPEVSREALAAHTEARWRQVGEDARIPDEARPVLLRLLGEGTTAAAVAESLGVTKWIARTYLERLRNEKVAYVDGVKRAARWRLAPSPGAGDGT